MAIKCGFFNSKSPSNRKEYEADDFGTLLDGIIGSGVFEHIGDCFAVHAVEGEMAVHVGTGKCWFNHKWLVNDSIFRLDLDPAYDLLNRYDSVIVEVNENVDTLDCTIKILKGTGASDPESPELTNTNFIHQYRIADIYIAADTDEITDANIIYYVGTEDTPYVTGPLEVVGSNEHWQHWYAELEEFTNDQEEAFNTWFQTIQDILDENVAAHLQNEVDDINDAIDTITAVNTFPITTTDWVANDNTRNNSTYTVKQVISTTEFANTPTDAQLDCFLLSATVDSVMTEAEKEDAYKLSSDVTIGATSITVYAEEATTNALRIRIKGV